MSLDLTKETQYLKILQSELIPACGCTEPIALAYAAATLRSVFGEMPAHITAECSGNIVKNVRSVNVPNAGTLRGIEAAVLVGAVAGSPERKLEVLSEVKPEEISGVSKMILDGICDVRLLHSLSPLHIILSASGNGHTALVELRDTHTNIVRIEKDGQILHKADIVQESACEVDYSGLNVKDIVCYADSVEISLVKELLDTQISYNLQIAEEGLSGQYGVNIARSILEDSGNTLIGKMKAYAAAASEARMSGCTCPVVINSGSGNQGIAVSIPIIIYARERGCSEEQLYRALAFSNLLSIHLKRGIGRLSAFCGAVTATCASAAAIAYLEGATLKQIEMTISNTFANDTGIICDGAKPSCGAKIATALDAAMMGRSLAMSNRGYESDTGILKGDIEHTIAAVGKIGSQGMVLLDQKVLEIMLEKPF